MLQDTGHHQHSATASGSVATPFVERNGDMRTISRKRSRHRIGTLIRHEGPLLLMAAPALVLLIVFSYIPMSGLIIAFEDYHPFQGVFGSDWVGLENFHFLFSTEDAWRITFNTIFMNVLFIVSTLLVSLAIALLLNEVHNSVPFLSKFYQSTLFFPYFISYVVVSYFVYAVLNPDSGILNHLLVQLGRQPINWYSTPQYWPTILTIVNLWKSAGFWSVVYLAGIIAINPEYYEAARIDGANRWQQIRYITLPALLPLIIINVLLSIGRIFYADFGLFFQVTLDSSLLYPTTDVIDTYVYRALTSTGDVGMAAAAGLYQSFVGFVLVILSNWIVRRADAEKALF